MAETKSLEEAELEEAKAAAGFKHANPSYGWFQACRCAVCILRRRIEELGR